MTTITTPFGRGRYNASRFSAQLAVRAAIHAQADDGAAPSGPSAQLRGNQPAAVHKWRLLRTLTEARERLGLGERALTVLSALLSFHPETALSLPGTGQGARREVGQGASPAVSLIVFPSNRELSLRAQGLCERSLARHLAALADAGLIIRRDSPNGKRYARKGRDGAIETAFGFDLTPLVLRATEFEDAADAIRREAAELRALRERCTLARRSAAGLLALAGEEGVPGPWDDYAALLAGMPAPRRRAGLAQMADMAAALEALAAGITEAVQQALDAKTAAKESGNARHSGSHQQNSNTDTSDSELASREARRDPPVFLTGPDEAARGCPATVPETKSVPARLQPNIPPAPLALGLVRQACPALAEWAGEVPRDWPAFVKAAQVARAALGISPDGWLEAVGAMGEQVAAVTVAAILERVEQAQFSKAGGEGTEEQERSLVPGSASTRQGARAHEPPALIRSPGGYLRSLSAKARAGTFRPEPFLMALIATRGRASLELHLT